MHLTPWKADLLRTYELLHGSYLKRLALCLLTPGVQAMLVHRFGKWVTKQSLGLRLPLKPLHWWLNRRIQKAWGIDTGIEAVIEGGCYIGHFGNIHISGAAILGKNVNLSQGVTVGDYKGCPTIGDAVYLEPGAKLYGNITVGEAAMIGPNAVIYEDVPEKSVVGAAVYQVLSSSRGNYH